MNRPASIVIRSSRLESSATCLVCGNDIAEGDGLTARYGDRTLRFKCPDCLSRFEADPERYLAGHEAGCCKDEQGELGGKRMALRLMLAPDPTPA